MLPSAYGLALGVHEVHLHAGLYAQTRVCKDLAMAVSGIGALILMQARCKAHCRAGRALGPWRQEIRPEEITVVAAELHAAIKQSLESEHLRGKRIGVVFRTRIAICQGELATPTRSDAESALEDWSTVQRAAAMGFRADRASCQVLLSSLRCSAAAGTGQQRQASRSKRLRQMPERCAAGAVPPSSEKGLLSLDSILVLTAQAILACKTMQSKSLPMYEVSEL